MTLMAIELPKFFLDILKEHSSNPGSLLPQALAVMLHVSSYLIFFLILYEIWTFHKSILISVLAINRSINLFTGLILVIIGFMPPIVTFIVEEKSQWILGQNQVDLKEMHMVVFVLFALIACLYGLLGLMASQAKASPKHEPAQPSQAHLPLNHGQAHFLAVCEQATYQRSLAFLGFALITLISIFYTNLIIPANFLMAIYVVFSFYQDELLGIFRGKSW